MVKLYPGDTLLYVSKGVLGKAIRYFMKKYAKKKYSNINPDYPICNHMGTVIEYDDKLYIAEAIQKGYVIKPISDAIIERLGKSIFVYRPDEPFNMEETKSISKYAISLSFNQTGYEFLTFIWWVIYIGTNFRLFLGGRKDKHVFCFEAAYRCLNESGRDYFETPYLLTAVDIQEDDKFKRII